MVAGREPTVCPRSAESQPYPGLHQKKRGQQAEGGDGPFRVSSQKDHKNEDSLRELGLFNLEKASERVAFQYLKWNY